MPTASVKTILSRMRQLEIRTRRLVNDSLVGEYHSVFKGRGMDFDEVREYVPGDEVRTIDWNVTARAGRPVRQEVHRGARADHTAAGGYQRLGQFRFRRRRASANWRRELASVLAFSAIRNSDKVGLLLYTDRVEQYIPPKKGRRHVLRVVREILYHTAERPGHGYGQGAGVASQLLHRRAVVFLISDFQSNGPESATRPPLRRAMRQTNRRHDLVAVHIEDPRERTLPDRGCAGDRGCGDRRGGRNRYREVRRYGAVSARSRRSARSA